MDAGLPTDRLKATVGLPGHGHTLHGLHMGVEGAHALPGSVLATTRAGRARLVLEVGLILGGGPGRWRAAPAQHAPTLAREVDVLRVGNGQAGPRRRLLSLRGPWEAEGHFHRC